jgi:hypothetical protein
MDSRSFCPCSVRLIAHRVNTACVDPPVVEIEQRANGDRIVDSLVRESRLVEGCDVRRLNGNGIVVYLPDKAKQNFLWLGKQTGFYIREHARNQFRAAKQFRRDRGVRLRSKRTTVQLRRVGGNQLTDARRERRGFPHYFLRESLQMRRGIHFVREHVQDLRIFRPGPLHHFDGVGVVVIALMRFYILQKHGFHKGTLSSEEKFYRQLQ